jgi:phage terminase large subunit
MDYGLDALGVLWYYVDGEGFIRIYREVYDHDLTISEAAKLIIEANSGDELAGFFAPPDMWNRRQETGESLAETFSTHGIFLTKADNNRVHGWELVKELLLPVARKDPQTGALYTTARLTIDDGKAPNLWRCLAAVQHDPNPKKYGDIQDKTPQEHELTHLPDALRYFACGRVFPSVPGIGGQKTKYPWSNDDDGEREEFVKW